MKLRHEFNHGNLMGVDVDLETSLCEYGFAWTRDDDEGEILFYYAIGGHESGQDRFDFCSFPNDLDIRNEFDWADFDRLTEFIGDDFWEQSLESQIYDLVGYYGFENVFGTSYWEGLTFEEIMETNHGNV